MLWIRSGFNADPDPAFNLNAEPVSDPGSQTNVDPGDPDPTFEAEKVEILNKK